MRKKEAGQVLILVLILLVIGALLLVPALSLSYTELKSSQIVVGKTKSLSAATAAQEWVLWNLHQPAFADNFTINVPKTYWIDVCDTPVTITIVMLATEGKGALVLWGDDVIQPTKTVECGDEDPPNEIPNDWEGTVTYTIRLEQLSDNTSQGLDVIYDIMPRTFEDYEFVSDSVQLKVDGVDKGYFPDPLIETSGEHAWGDRIRLRWPNPEVYPFLDNFNTDPVFKGIRDFEVRQVKELSFDMYHEFKGLDKDSTHGNWVVLMPWKSLSGPQAPIVVGDANPQKYNSEEGLIGVSKVSDPEVIQPFQEQFVQYTITLINYDGMPHKIDSITDYLPPGFHYDNVTFSPPFGTIFEGRDEEDKVPDPSPPEEEEFNEVTREVVHWGFPTPVTPVLNISAGANMTLSFWTFTTKDVSGYYFNEVVLKSDVTVPWIFVDDIGLTDEEFNSNYSWATGGVMVPSYDSEADADGEIIDTNFALVPGGVIINSWNIR